MRENQLQHDSHMYCFAYFYCQELETYDGVLRGILTQLLEQNQNILPYLESERVSSAQKYLKSGKLLHLILETVLEACGQVYLIIDGVDELELDERRKLLSALFPFLQPSPDKRWSLKIFISSRNEKDIKDALVGKFKSYGITKEDNGSDITSYITTRVLKMQEMLRLSDSFKKEIIAALCKHADGMDYLKLCTLKNMY